MVTVLTYVGVLVRTLFCSRLRVMSVVSKYELVRTRYRYVEQTRQSAK
jgi:hypothetical protein